MTRSDLIEQVARELQLSTSKAELVVNTILSSMEDFLARGDRIEARGFGSFEIRHFDGYAGRNPRTGDAVEVRPKRLPFFKVGKEMKARLAEVGRRDAAKKRAATGESEDASERRPVRRRPRGCSYSSSPTARSVREMKGARSPGHWITLPSTSFTLSFATSLQTLGQDRLV